MVANVAVASTLVFYDSLLPHLAAPDEIDRVSTAGYAIGFIGGGILLLINLAWILTPSTFGLPDAIGGHAADVRQRRRVVARLLAAAAFAASPSHRCSSRRCDASGLRLVAAAAAASWRDVHRAARTTATRF